MFTSAAQTSMPPSRLIHEPRLDSRAPLAPPHDATRSTLSRRRSPPTPPTLTRCPPLLARGPADACRGGRCCRPGLRGTGGDADAIRGARAELSPPHAARAAGDRSSERDRPRAGTGGARRPGLIRHDDGAAPVSSRAQGHGQGELASCGNQLWSMPSQAGGDGTRATAGEGGAPGARTRSKKSPDDAR